MWRYYALGSAFFAALTAIFIKLGIKSGAQDLPANLATAIRTVVVLLLAWGVVLWRGESGELFHISRVSLAFLVLSGVATGLSWLCYFRALHDGPAKVVAPLDKLSLPLVIVLAALILKEPFTRQTAAGMALISAGIWVLVREAAR